MNSHKRRINSTLLGRMAHADIFEVGTAPKFLFTLFGGSGVDEDEYELRSRSVIPIFGSVLRDLEDCGMDLVMAHVTAPYDVPFNRFSADPSSADTWNAHVSTELLLPWSLLPYFVSGFSGGAALALNGLQQAPRCFGGAALGADAIPPEFVCPDHWAGKLRLYAAPDDRVCNAPENRLIVEALERRGQVEVFRLRCGRHRLEDYATIDCLGGLIRVAAGLVPGPSGRG
ncbi:MAG TPA: hypothetical protein VKP69_17720 [Isosphaeraceae bacterium]|nr:hypothetical protein [Isosphaeraceae bacterium]